MSDFLGLNAAHQAVLYTIRRLDEELAKASLDHLVDLRRDVGLNAAHQAVLYTIRRLDEELAKYPDIERLKVARDRAKASLDHLVDLRRDVDLLQKRLRTLQGLAKRD